MAVGQDSFLDVVTNIVGILIILVIVVGLRVKNAPLQEVRQEAIATATAALEKELELEKSLRADVLKTAEEIRKIERELIHRHQQRSVLATREAAWEQKLRAARDQLDTESRRSFDLQQATSDAQRELEDLLQRCAAAENVQPEPILVESYPTPLAKTVDENELHFLLRGSRVAWIPLESLVDRFKADARQKAYRLLELPELTETVGPEGGFRLRYTMERHEVPIETQVATGRGAFARLKRWTLIPTSSELGEPIEAALREGSEFRKVLSRHRPDQVTVTVWTYPDSFEAFRKLKKALFELGYATAARPLPEGVPISGSPEGSKSAAE